MSIQSEITRLTNRRNQSFTKVASKGVTVPSGSTMDDLPDLIELIEVEDTYSITKNLTDVSSSADDTKVIQGNSFFTRLAPIPNNYVISEITVTMGGVDVTSQVFHPDDGGSSADLGTKTITENGTYNASSDNLDGYSQVTVNVSGGVTPTGTKQISITSNGTTMEDVTDYASAEIIVNVPTGTARTSADLTVSGATVTAPAGLYASAASKSVATGTEGTPTATKGTVSNHSVSVTPSVTNTEGYISGGTQTGTAVSVSASELVSGSETKTANGTYDVTNLAEIVVDVPSSGSSRNVQISNSNARRANTALGATSVTVTCSKTGTYNIYWSAFRVSTSSSYTQGTQLAINGTLYGSEQTSWTNSYNQSIRLQNVELEQGDVLTIWARSRSTSYYVCVSNLTVIEVVS